MLATSDASAPMIDASLSRNKQSEDDGGNNGAMDTPLEEQYVQEESTEHRDEDEVDVSRLSTSGRADGVEGNALREVFSYLQSIDRSMTRLEARVSTIESGIGDIKAQLQTITLLLWSLSEGHATRPQSKRPATSTER